MAKNKEEILCHPEEVVMEPIHAFVHHAKCPYCKTGNLYFQAGIGMVIGKAGRVAPHECRGCKKTTHLDEGQAYPKVSCGEYGSYKYFQRD